MKKENKTDTIFKKYYGGIRNGVPFDDLPKDILPTDRIDIEEVPGHWSENNSWEDHTILKVYRVREETDQEFEERKLLWEKRKEESRKLRYEQYLKLKEEFEK